MYQKRDDLHHQYHLGRCGWLWREGGHGAGWVTELLPSHLCINQICFGQHDIWTNLHIFWHILDLWFAHICCSPPTAFGNSCCLAAWRQRDVDRGWLHLDMFSFYWRFCNGIQNCISPGLAVVQILSSSQSNIWSLFSAHHSCVDCRHSGDIDAGRPDLGPDGGDDLAARVKVEQVPRLLPLLCLLFL